MSRSQGRVDEDMTAFVREQMPFAAELGLEILCANREEVSARTAWAPERCTAGGVLHGGFLMAVADSIGAACAALNLPSGALTSTIESKTNFLRPVSSGGVVVVAHPVHVGRSTMVIQTDVIREDGSLVSRTLQTQAIVSPPPVTPPGPGRGAPPSR